MSRALHRVRLVLLLALALTKASACVPIREPMLMRPLPPGFEYPWRAASEARVRIGASLAVARASLLVSDAFVLAHSATSTPRPDVVEPALVDLNTATLDELDTLPRVGPSLAAAIVEARPFRRVEDLRRVRGVGSATFAQLRPLVTVNAP